MYAGGPKLTQEKSCKIQKEKEKKWFKIFMSEKIFTCMQEVPNLHKNYSSGAII